MRLLCWSLCVVFTLSLAAPLVAADPTWTVIGEEVLAKVKPGYPGKTAGITVDRVSGDVFLVVPDQGLWKSSDQGKTFERVDGKAVGGRCETGFALAADPEGKRLACFMIYGASATTTDGGKTFTTWKTNHLDFGDVDWAETGKAMVGLRHENKDICTLTTDGGATWKDIGHGFKAIGIFDPKTIVGSKRKGIVRSTDGGETWKEISELTPKGRAVRSFKGKGYWVSDAGVLVSSDKGATWSVLGTPVKAAYGPYFGKDESHLLVVNNDGWHETTDAGKTWKKVAPLPPGYKADPVGPNFGYDPVNKVFYASAMGKDAYKLPRQ